MTLDLLQAEESAAGPKSLPQNESQGRGSPFWKFANLLKIGVCAPYELISEISASNDLNSWHLPEIKLSRTLNSALSPPIQIAQVKACRILHKVSFTGVILECFSGALRRFMMEAGFDVPRRIHCAVPLPMPQHPQKKMRNHL